MANYDTCVSESNHKQNAKSPAKLTQQTADNFEYQTAERYIDNLQIDWVFGLVSSPELKKKRKKFSTWIIFHN